MLLYDNINKGIVTKPSHTCTSQKLPQVFERGPCRNDESGLHVASIGRNLQRIISSFGLVRTLETRDRDLMCWSQPRDSNTVQGIRKSCKGGVNSNLVGGIIILAAD
jgi:hypothetical protein